MENNFSLRYRGKTIDISKIAESLAAVYKLDLVVVFGSGAKDKLHYNSDLDLGFMAKERLDFHQIVKQSEYAFWLSSFDKINLIDMFFPRGGRVTKGELQLLQYEIYRTGQALYESRPGLFEEKKKLALSDEKFANADVRQLIVRDKIEHIRSLIESLSSSRNFYIATKFENLLFEEQQELQKIINKSSVALGQEIVHASLRLNRFLLAEYRQYEPFNMYDSFDGLLKFKSLTVHEKSMIQQAAKMAGFESLITTDYIHGTESGIDVYLAYLEHHYFTYLDAISRLIESGKMDI